MRKLYNSLFTALRKVKLFDSILSLPVISKIIEYEVLMYLVFGVLTTVVNFVVFFLFDHFGNNNKVLFTLGNFTLTQLYLANTVAWICAVLFAFVTNKLLVFESKSAKAATVAREFLSFAGARVLSLILFDWILFYLLCEVGHMNEYLAKVIYSICTIVFNYAASKLVIFRKKPDNTAK